MTTFSEIESAARALSPEEKQRLLVALAESLRTEGRSLPAPRRFTSAEIEKWIEEDERDLESYRQGS